MAVPTIEWNEANPPGSQLKSLGAERIRELKTQFREVFAVDHVISSSGSGDTWGCHKKATLYNQSSDPIPSADTGCLFAKDVSSLSELHWVDESDNVIQITSAGDVITGMPGEVRIWSGAIADIPYTWALCDGVSNPLNLVNKFIRGVNTSLTDPGTTGGTSDLQLAEANLPAHTHTVANESAHTHYILMSNSSSSGTRTFAATGSSTYLTWYGYPQNESSHTHTISSSGGTTKFNNRPAYLENAFIIKTA